MKIQDMWHMLQYVHFQLRMWTNHIGSVLLTVSTIVFLLKYQYMKINIVLIWTTPVITCTRRLVVTNYIGKYHLVWNIDVICDTLQTRMRPWYFFTKEKRCCQWNLPSEHLTKIIIVSLSTKYIFTCHMLPCLGQITAEKQDVNPLKQVTSSWTPRVDMIMMTIFIFRF